MSEVNRNYPTPLDSLESSASSFDSTNSFYSTDSSSSSSSLSPAWHILDEQKFNQKYAQEVNLKVTQFVAEISGNSGFQTLLNLPSVQVETSTNPATPFCFRTCAEFQGHSAQDAFAFFVDLASRGAWDAMCHSVTVLKQLDALTFIYHLQLKATWPTTARDSLNLVAFRKLSDGRYVSVAWSIEDDRLCPPDPSAKFIRMQTRISANLFTPTPSGFRLNQLIDGDPKGNIPSFVIKKVSAKSFPDTIEAIKRALACQKQLHPDFYNSILDAETSNAQENQEADCVLLNSTDPLSLTLQEINSRLLVIEDQLRNSPQIPVWQVWAPIAMSSVSLLLLLNLNLRKK